MFSTSRAAAAFALRHAGSRIKTVEVTYRELQKLRDEGKLEYGG